MRVILAPALEGIGKIVKQMLSSEVEKEVVGRVSGNPEVLPDTGRLLPEAVISHTGNIKSSRAIINSARTNAEAQLPTRAIITIEKVARDLMPAVKAGTAGLLGMSDDGGELLSALKVPANNVISEPVHDAIPLRGFKEVP